MEAPLPRSAVPDRLEAHLQRGGAFIAVGALHLPGEDGLIRLLGQRGYSLRMIH